MAVKEVSNSPIAIPGQRVYQASDGRQFSSRAAAEAHEASFNKSGGAAPAASSATSSTRGGGGSRSYTSPPGGSLGANVTGYDPNWFRSLPLEIQRLAQQERQKAGYAPLPVDRPLSFGESMAGTPIRVEDVPPGALHSIRGAEQAAFADWQREQQLAALQAQYDQQMATLQAQYDAMLQALQKRLSQLAPATVETEPKTEVQSAPAPASVLEPEKLPGGMRRGQAGFEYTAVPVVAPSVEDLLKIYKEVFGPQEGAQEEYVRQYLGGPEFWRVLSGAVPVWMEADPLWRLYLHRLGLLQNAVGRRLESGA
ncbi:MAG: hypothetical protein ACUVRO_11120 [Armatimonadota bacterium]